MKRLLAAVLCSVMTLYLFAGCESGIASQDPETTVPVESEKISANVTQGNTNFAFDIFNRINGEDKEKSVFISPLSISTALTMVYQGAGTTTRDAMAKALKYEGFGIDEVNDSYKNLLGYLKQVDSKIELDINNSIWIRKGEEVKEDFLAVNRDVFNADITTLDFNKADEVNEINKWISDSTRGKISKMIEPPISQDIIMYLINAIYFKGDWTEQFDKAKTFDTKFKSGDGKKKDIKMMSRNGKVEYGKTDDAKVVKLPYGDEKVAMYCILPDEDISVNDFITALNPEKWEKIKDSVSETGDVTLQLPRFKIEYGTKELNSSLTAMGMGEAFSDSADFTGIGDNIAISRVLHKAVIEVNEEGSEAAGVTAVEVQTTSMREPITFTADRPFVFVIADEQYGTILFMGKLYDVEQ